MRTIVDKVVKAIKVAIILACRKGIKNWHSLEWAREGAKCFGRSIGL